MQHDQDMSEQLKEQISRVQDIAKKMAVSFEGQMAQALVNHRLMQAQAALVSGSENAMRISCEELRGIRG